VVEMSNVCWLRLVFPIGVSAICVYQHSPAALGAFLQLFIVQCMRTFRKWGGKVWWVERRSY